MFGLPRPELDSWYSFSVCGLENRAIRATGEITIMPQGSLSDLRQADTIVIPGWCKPITTPPEPLIHALLKAHERGARLVSLCVGAFVLGAIGHLKGGPTHRLISLLERFTWSGLDTSMVSSGLGTACR